MTQDEGTCAAPTTVGDRYTYGVWYRSTAPVQLVSYRRLDAGGYLTFGLSAPFVASPNAWSYASVVTRPMPAGSTGISIGIAIKTAGQFTFDDFSLLDSGPPPPVTPAPVASDFSTPSAAPLSIPVVVAAQVSAIAPKSSPTRWIAIGAVLLLAALTLGLIDRRLARRRRR